VPVSVATPQQQVAVDVRAFGGDVTESQLVPPQALVPMVPVVEEQVTQWYPLHVVCSMLRDQGRVVDLENLLWGSTGIRREDRKMVFMWTLQSYVDHGMLDRAVMLSKRLEWEGLAYDFPEFHNLMGSLIQNYTYRIELPVEHSPALSMSLSPASTPYASCPSTPISSGTEEQLAIQAYYHRKLKKAIAKESGSEGLAALNELEKTGKQINVTELSSLVELLVKEELLLDATNVTEKMLRRDTYPMPKIFRFLLNRLAATGQVEMMNTVGQYLTTTVKKEVSFDNRLCNAYLAAGRGAEYLDALERELDAVAGCSKDDEKVQILKEKFPRGGAMGLLESDPNLVDQYTRLANKFLSFDFVAPVNVLWTYHFINGRYDVAEALWQSHVKSCPQIMFQKVCQTARTTGNAELAWRLVDLLHNATVTQGARGIAYSCLIDVLTQQGSYAEGCDALKSALCNGVHLSDINRTALKRLKEGLEGKGFLFPYDIPKKMETPSECDSELSMAVACI
jgi:leucine-rich PPR motif-containing protein, mitochondrial